MGLMSRRKGAGYEREICAQLRDALGDPTISRELAQSRDGGEDIQVGPFVLECKRRKSLSLYQWLRQAESAAAQRGGCIPVVVARGDNQESVVILALSDFIPLMKAHAATEIRPVAI